MLLSVAFDLGLMDPETFFESKIVIILLPINLNMCLGYSKEPSNGDGSFEYPQHMFLMRNKENSFPIHTLIWRLGVFTVCQSTGLGVFTICLSTS